LQESNPGPPALPENKHKNRSRQESYKNQWKKLANSNNPMVIKSILTGRILAI